METKLCAKCSTTKHISEFYTHTHTKDGYRSACKVCIHKQNTIYSKNIKHTTDLIEKTCTKCLIIKHISQFSKRTSTKSGHKSHCKLCLSVSRKIWQETYKPKRNAMRRLRRLSDTNYRLTAILRGRLLSAIKLHPKPKPTLDLIGCSIEHLKQHLQESAINNGYSEFDIEKFSGNDYHIDHIIPCSLFDLTIQEEQEKCFHYTNLQILTATENLHKSNKLLI